MSAREHSKQAGQNISNGPVKSTRPGSRPRSKKGNRNMANSSRDSRAPEDVDSESIPLTDKEVHKHTHHSDTSGVSVLRNGSEQKNGGPPVKAQIPNSVPSDMEEESNVKIVKETVSCKTVPNGDIRGGGDKSETKEVDINKSVIEEQTMVTQLTPESHRNGSVKSDKGMKRILVPVVANIVPRKQSLTVPGSTAPAGDTQNGADRPRSDSVFSMGRESSKLSLGSPRSLEMKVNYSAVQMPTDDKNKSVFTPDESLIRVAIPYLPLWVSTTCLLMNIIIPGSGTILSGCCIFCCGESRVPAKFDQDRLLLMCVNVWVGVAQLFTVSFLLVGWFWSLAWGIKMVILSVEKRHEMRNQRANELKTLALSAFGSAIPARLSDPS